MISLDNCADGIRGRDGIEELSLSSSTTSSASSLEEATEAALGDAIQMSPP